MDITTNGTAVLGAHRRSAPEIMGAAGFAELRAAGEALVAALRRTRRHRKALSTETVAAIAAAEVDVLRAVGGVLDRMADERGVPAEGESISLRESDGDYHVSEARCWVWNRSVDSRGYPVIGRRTAGAENAASRIYWILANGPIDEGDSIERTCGHRRCVNPGHGVRRNRAERGAAHARKLTDDDVRTIRNEAAKGIRRGDIAERFAIAPRYLSQIISGEHWKDPDYVRGCPLEGGTISTGRHYKWAAGDYKIDRVTGCWIWLRSIDGGGGPRLMHEGKHRSAARVYWEAANGAIGPDLHVVRSCDNRVCVNPRHASAVTAEEKAHRMLTLRKRSRRSRQRVRGLRVRGEVLAQIEPLLARARQEAIDARYRRRSLWLARSLDAPMGDGPGAGALADVIGDQGAADPFEVVRAAELLDILGDLDEETIAGLPDDALLALRERLLAADFVPSTTMALA